MIQKNNTGFTLIELLVVVLIIGILAAVALPQYQISVKKARFSKLRSTAHSLYRGVDAFYLATNSWPDSFDEMDIDFPGEPSQQNKCKTNNEMYCCVIAPVPTMYYGQIVCGQTDYSFAYKLIYADHSSKKPVQPYGICYEREGTNLCRAVTQKNGTNDNVLTPLGFLQRKAFVISND